MKKLSEFSKLKLITEIYKDPNRKSLFQILKEIFYLAFLYKSFPKHYISRFLFKKDRGNIRNYFPSDYLDKITTFFNDYNAKQVVENKLFYDLYYKQFGIRLPKTIMYNHKTLFVAGNNNFLINNFDEFRERLKTVFSENSNYNSIFIKKTYGSYGGYQIYKLYREQLNNDVTYLRKIYTEVIKSGYLFQETIIQHSEMDKLNPSCINSIRMDAFTDSNGKVEIISAYLRINISDSYFDNISQGGYGIGINLHNGELKKYGFCKPSNGIKLISTHPITGVTFEGFQIPYFEQAKEMVIKAAGCMPLLRLVGWDIAIEKSGPMLMEGNSGYAAHGNELLDGGYRNNAVYLKAIKEYNEFSKF